MRVIRIAPLAAASTLALCAATGGAVRAQEGHGPILAGVPNAAFVDTGVPPVVPVRLAVVLRYRHQNDLRPLAAQLSVGSGEHVLTAAQFVAYFSPPAGSYRQVADALTQMGFRVVGTYPNRTVLDVEAPAAVVDRAFATTVHAVVQPALLPAGGRARTFGRLRYANVKPAILPDRLRESVYGVVGFNNLELVRPAYVLQPPVSLADVAIGPPLRGPDGGFGPFAFVSAYNFPVQHHVRGGKPGQTYDGTGQATANVMDSDFQDADLAAFLKYFSITRTGPPTRRVLVDGGPNPRINEDEIETDLDVETIVGTTPGTALWLYLYPKELGDAGVVDTYERIVSDDAVDAVNSSFTVCENADRNYATTTDHIALQGALLGINFSAASGDDGSRCPGGNGVGSPASGPHFIATGGTTLYVSPDGRYVSETGWDDSGGGVSEVFSRPAYQNGIRNVIGTMRNLPDIAFDANPATGASLYMNGRFAGPVGGTSLASPLTTALVTQLDQFNGSRLGDLHPWLYGGFRSLGYGEFDGLPAFRDVVGGSNGMYQCTTGYDLVTGIGSVDGAGAANAYKPG